MFTNPRLNLEQLELQKGMKVADLGVGAGFYATEAAQIVGEDGRIYAVDVQKDLVETVKKKCQAAGLNNVEGVWADIEKIGGTKIKDGVLDACIVSNILFIIDDRETFANEINRVLKSGGKVLVVDWLDSFGGLGPARNQVFPKEQAESLFARTNFKIEKHFDAGDHHYGFIAIKP